MTEKAPQEHQHPTPLPDDPRDINRITKVPTGLGQEPLNIVILGASFAGLSVAHHFLDHTLNHLRITKAAPNYRLVMVSLSTHFYWNIAAPRALVSPEFIKQDDIFMPIEQGFHRHRGHNFSIIQGDALAMDTSARTVTIEVIGSTAQKRASQVNKRLSRASVQLSSAQGNPKVQTISYHALIIATGSSSESDLLKLRGPHLNTLGALNTFHLKVVGARSIIICGGGPSGVETAGQLATFLNYGSHWPIKRHVKRPKKIILITGADRCLPNHKAKVGTKAERMLRKLGVEVKHMVRVIAAKEGFDLTGQTKVELNDDTSLIADLYIACTGVQPNTSYAPVNMKNPKGYIQTNKSSLRVDAALAGPRVYAVGDCASYSQNYLLDVYAAIPVLMHNLLNDLLEHEYRLASPYGGNQDKIDDLKDEVYTQRRKDTQLCPISRFGGVGVLSGRLVPKFLVHFLKGQNYRIRQAKRVVEDGGNPYAVHGNYEWKSQAH